MALVFHNKLVVLSGAVSVEDAEPLLAWLQDKPAARVDFKACVQVHPANLQVLLAAGARVAAWPADAALAAWLKSAFQA